MLAVSSDHFRESDTFRTHLWPVYVAASRTAQQLYSAESPPVGESKALAISLLRLLCNILLVADEWALSVDVVRALRTSARRGTATENALIALLLENGGTTTQKHM
jgi:hypothetical protein